MESVPAYLAWYFLRIRRHLGERGYFSKRFSDMDPDEVAIETQMVEELFVLDLVLYSEEDLEEKVVHPLRDPLPPAGAPSPVVRESIPYHSTLYPTPRGKYFVREGLVGLACRSAWTAVVALLGVLVGLALGN